MNVTRIHLDETAQRAQSPKTERPELRKAVNELVGMTFFNALLQMSSDSALKGEYGHGGRGEEIFTSQLNTVLANNVSSSSRFELADAIYEQLAKRYTSELAGHQDNDIQINRLNMMG